MELGYKFWEKRWQEGKTGWHFDEPNQNLVENSTHLLPDSGKCRVLLPLCGKSVDLFWLYEQGHEVVGIDCIYDAAKQFFDSHKIEFTVEDLPSSKLFKNLDGRLCIYICDFFTVSPDTVGTFDAVWDRGALVALGKEDRKRYAPHVKTLLKSKFRYLLATVSYTTEREGPPHSVPVREVEKLYGDSCDVKVLNTVDMTKDKKLTAAGILDGSEIVILITPKAV